MNPFKRKIALRVLGIHLGVILFFTLVSGLKGCFRPKPRPEIVTFIEFGSPAPAVNVQEVTRMADPEPVKPTPAPTPEPTVVPEPVKKTVELPKPTKKQTPTPKKVDPPKPKPPEKKKWTPTKVDPTKSKRIEPKASVPIISEKDIEKTLSGIVSPSSSPSTTTGNPDADAAYISQIGSFFDRRWTKPESSAPAASAVVRINISKWGTITQRTKIQGSGDAAFDASVMSAVNSVNSVPKPPSSFPYDYVEVEFRIRN